MKNVVWKFPLYHTERQSISMPGCAQILSCQLQGDQICLWALCNPDAPTRLRHFMVVGTGDYFELQNHEHVETVIQGDFVWHVFEVTV